MDLITRQILLGSLCGDGCCHSNGVYSEVHCIAQKEYILYKLSFFEKITIFKFKDYLSEWGFSKGKWYSHCYSFKNLIFLDYRNLFYKNGKKEITLKILNKLNWLGIAIWFCDDGHYAYRHKRIAIATHPKNHNNCFLYFKSLGFNPSTTDKELVFGVEDTKLIIKKIKRYVLKMPKCIHYKIGLDKKKNDESNNKNLEYQHNYYNQNQKWIISKKKKLYDLNKDKLNLIRRTKYSLNPQKRLKENKNYRNKQKKLLSTNRQV